MMCSKYYYYVLVKDGKGGGVFVTGIPERNVAVWDKGETPKAFTRKIADEIAVGLCCNFTPAYVLVSSYEIDEQIFAK